MTKHIISIKSMEVLPSNICCNHRFPQLQFQFNFFYFAPVNIVITVVIIVKFNEICNLCMKKMFTKVIKIIERRINIDNIGDVYLISIILEKKKTY